MVYNLLNFLTFLIPMAVYIYILVYLFGYQFRNDKSKKVFTIIISVYTAVEVVFIFVLKNKEISDLFFEVSLIASAPMIPVFFLNTKKKFNLSITDREIMVIMQDGLQVFSFIGCQFFAVCQQCPA